MNPRAPLLCAACTPRAHDPLAGAGAPGRDVARARRIVFTRAKKAGPRPEKLERTPVGWRAQEWRRMLDEGVYRNQSELARGEGVSTAAVSIALGKLQRGGR